MARKRMIHPEFFISDDVAALSIPARLTFIGLWCYFDDDGRGKDSAAAVRAAVWGMDDEVTTTMVATHLAEIEAVDGICRYTTDGHRYMHAPAWTNWQKVSHPADPRIPPCPKHGGRPAKEDGRGKRAADPWKNYGDSPETLGDSPRTSPQVVSAVSAVQVRKGSEVPPAAEDRQPLLTSTGECIHFDPHPELCARCRAARRWVG